MQQGAALALGALTLPFVGCDASFEAANPCLRAAADDGAGLYAFDADAIPVDLARFPLPLSAGAVTHERALIVGYVATLGHYRLRVWRDATTPGKAHLLRDERITVDDGYFHYRLEGLAAGHRYRYGLFAEEGGQLVARSSIGALRACLPLGCREPVTIAATACTHRKLAPFAALSRMAAEPVDAICHLGDISYNDGATTLEQYRESWRKTLLTQGYRDLFPHAALYATRDDHEFADDARLYDLPAAQRAAARQALFEHVAIPDLGWGRIWNSYRWGESVEFFVLDCRSERRPETRETDDPIYISNAQLAWLKVAVPSSPCHFKVLLNSVPITEFPSFWVKAEDRWQGYAAQREQLLAALDDVPNVWFLSGDFHIGLVARIEAEGHRRDVWEILAGPGGNDNALWQALAASPVYLERAAPKERFPYFGAETAATFLTFDPGRDEVRVRFIDAASGETRYDAILAQGREPRSAAG